MDEKKEDKKENSEVREPIATYQRTIHTENVPVMPLEQALKKGMTLEESKRIMNIIDESYEYARQRHAALDPLYYYL